MTNQNGSFNVPSGSTIEQYAADLYHNTQASIEHPDNKDSIAVLSTLRGVIALQIGIYRELKNK